MSSMSRSTRYLCVHGHFYRPPRGNPITGHIGEEPAAGAYRNWNERITAESYQPNAEIGNFERISFDVNDALLRWLARRHEDTYQKIIDGNQKRVQQTKFGNALGSPAYNVILPLLKRRDKVFQLTWGKAAFRKHFGRDPLGLWLPEMAVDLPTLEAAHALGYRFTILSQGQVIGATNGAGPYWVELPSGGQMGVFIRNDALSNDLSFNIDNVGGAGHWARNTLAGGQVNQLTLLAISGETFGHHHLGEEQFLKWLLEHEAPSVGFKVVTLEQTFNERPPRDTVEIKEFSSFSSTHAIAPWSLGWTSDDASAGWKAPLLRALEYATQLIDDLYQEAAWTAGLDPWQLRNEYVRVWLEQTEPEAFLAEQTAKPSARALAEPEGKRLLMLLAAERFASRAYSSDAFYQPSIESPEGSALITAVAYATYLAEQATGLTLADEVKHQFRLVTDSNGKQGHILYDEIASEYGLIPSADAVQEAEIAAEITDKVEPA